MSLENQYHNHHHHHRKHCLDHHHWIRNWPEFWRPDFNTRHVSISKDAVIHISANFIFSPISYFRQLPPGSKFLLHHSIYNHQNRTGALDVTMRWTGLVTFSFFFTMPQYHNSCSKLQQHHQWNPGRLTQIKQKTNKQTQQKLQTLQKKFKENNDVVCCSNALWKFITAAMLIHNVLNAAILLEPRAKTPTNEQIQQLNPKSKHK